MKRYLSDKRNNALRKGLRWDLTLSDIHWLLYMARITISDVGQRSHQYHLARFNDTGGYTKGNCRFITAAENLKERVAKNGAWTPERKKAASERAKKQWREGNLNREMKRNSKRDEYGRFI